MMYQRILVPVDDSTAALYALKEACRLAKQLDAAILAVHVVDIARFDWGAPTINDSAALQKAVEAAGIKVLERSQAEMEAAGIRYDSLIMESAGDRIADLLVEQAAAENCNLIVMGTHGFSGLMHLLMGSVAEGVVRKSDVPVLLVRHKDD